MRKPVTRHQGYNIYYKNGNYYYTNLGIKTTRYSLDEIITAINDKKGYPKGYEGNKHFNIFEGIMNYISKKK